VVLFFRVAVPAWVMMGYWFLLQLLSTSMGQVGGVAFWAHIGGFIAGVLLIYPFRSEALLANRAKMIQARAWAGEGI
jgi:membrane associated rhomboid family serine protease